MIWGIFLGVVLVCLLLALWDMSKSYDDDQRDDK